MPEATPDKSPPPLSVDTVVVAIQSAPWWKSKTLWANLIALLIAIISAPELVDLVGPAKAVTIVGTVIPVLNGILRLITFAPLTGTMGATSATAAQPAALRASVQASSPTLVLSREQYPPAMPPGRVRP